MHTGDSSSVFALERHFVVERVTCGTALREAQRLRHQVFRLERDILPATTPARLEADEFDETSHHVVLRERRSGDVVGTARLVIGGVRNGRVDGFPMLHYCEPEILDTLPMGTTAEISRFALSKARRHQGEAADRLLRYALMRGILRISHDIGLTHWCALMEPSLMRLLRAAGIDFKALGPAVEAHGLRHPCAAAITRVLAEGSRRSPELYGFVAGVERAARQPVLNAA
ncbi:MAG: GNAT family N-acetyltransferase [Acetobacteraceae bacterium]|nr:GNAT family N-acetyltransferase [Acetobacteraceae bacterium]